MGIVDKYKNSAPRRVFLWYTGKMKRQSQKNKKRQVWRIGDPTKSGKLYRWLLGGFTVWFFVVFFLFRGIVADLLATPVVPDWVVPYNKEIAQRVSAMTQGHPIAQMNEYIARFDESTAGYLVAIAKKESNWGKRAPVLEGEDCYNYWGFRDPDNTAGSGGHTCFESPEQAVRSVGKRVHELVYTYERDTPKEMVVWKCGSACAGDAGAQKWVSDVGWYYDKFLEEEIKNEE
jgi:hypothetical protein